MVLTICRTKGSCFSDDQLLLPWQHGNAYGVLLALANVGYHRAVKHLKRKHQLNHGDWPVILPQY